MANSYPFRHFLTNGVTTNMAVNGSVTPVNFDFAPTTAGERFTIRETSFILGTNGNVNDLTTKFADLAALTNGLDVDFLFNTVGFTRVGYVKTNYDLFRIFVSQANVKNIGNTTLLTGTIVHDPQVIFQPNDRFRVTVRDDLTGLVAMSLVVAGKMYK